MPVLRRCGGSVSMRLPPKRICPAVRSAKPAIVRSSVVLPQPEGPSSVKNSPSAISSDTSSTARTVPNNRETWSIEIAVKTSPENKQAGFGTLTGRLDHVLDAIHRFAALLRPAFLVVLHKLDVGKLGHFARQVGQIEILACRPAERLLEDHLANVLAVDVVDELTGAGRVRAILDDRYPFHLDDGAVGRIDHLRRRAVVGPQVARIFERDT